MLRVILKSKLQRLKVTQTNLYYDGSITLDAKLMKRADILEGERVDVLNLNNGQRIQTYVIAGKAGSGQVCLNGPAARSGCVGDEIIVLSYAWVDEDKIKKIRPRIIKVDEHNRPKD